MKKIFKPIMLGFFLSLILNLQSQIPLGYYDDAEGLSGAPLKTALYNIIKGHTDKGYDGLYACYLTTDNLPGNKVFDMYSVKADSTATYWYTNASNSSDQCGNYNSEADCYNREHSFCDSWLGESSPQRSDLFHVYPTDGYVNNRRSSYPHGKVGTSTWTSSNGSKLGSSDPSTGYSGVVFEPIDIYKGDFARSYFYMATRYENLIAGWVNNSSANEILAGNAYPAYKTWFLNLMIQWHTQDPVSQKEILRNEAVYAFQHNRNPYIDHPEWVYLVWGSTPIPVTSVTVTSQTGIYEINSNLGTLQMIATVQPNNATNQTVSWSVINGSGTATISSNGLLSASTNGTVTVRATAIDGSGVFGEKLITISNQTVGISESNHSAESFIFFKPETDFLSITTKKTSEDYKISIYDLKGSVLYVYEGAISNVLLVDVHAFPKGMYLVSLKSSTQSLIYKFIR